MTEYGLIEILHEKTYTVRIQRLTSRRHRYSKFQIFDVKMKSIERNGMHEWFNDIFD